MTPDVVAQEMKGRTVYAYFFNITGTPENPSEVRDQVKIFSGSILGTQEHKKNNSHTLVWDLLTEPGTSGSPVLDLERHLIVSVCSGPLSKKTHGGGLISAEICQWVKSHDASMKCLRVEGGKDRQEKPGTAKWGK